MGAAISNIATYPLALIVTRLQIQRQLRSNTSFHRGEEYKSIQDAAYKIYRQEGSLDGFYTGVLQDTSKTIADSFLFFLAYNFLRQSRLRSREASLTHLPVLDELSVGFVAGAFSKLLTTPIANIVTRKQASSMLSSHNQKPNAKPVSVKSIAAQIRSERGLQGFWSGYSASLVLTLNPSLTFFLFETFKRTFLPHHRRNDPPAQVTFILAAFSKAIASTITYPFSLAKSRLQISSSIVDGNHSEGEGATLKSTTEKTTTTQKLTKGTPSSVFSTILQIARTEGIGALYEGLGGEVLKGFFSHGITMIVKETVHKLIIQLYYTILRLLKKYPSPQELAKSAEEQAGQAFSDLEKQTERVVLDTKENVKAVVEIGREVAKNVSTSASRALNEDNNH